MVTTGQVIVAGEITSKSHVDIQNTVRNVIKGIGYTNPDYGFDYRSCGIAVMLDQQSPDISQGVTEAEGLHTEMGAGDQGMMFGYACRETSSLMPLPITLSHKILQHLARVRKKGAIKYLRPDAKSQVTVDYVDGRPRSVETVVVSTQHDPDASYARIQRDMIAEVKKVIPKKLLTKNTKYHINPTGRFVVGGPQGDCGLTGRKIIVDTYGGYCPHGGGAFSGKDPSKVDRSAHYMARYVAKNLVAAGLADRCQVQLAYAIGVPEPVSVLVDTYGTGSLADEALAGLLPEVFDLTPKGIIKKLRLLRPIYQKTTNYGHFGRNDVDFTWEKTDKIRALKQVAGS
jgi:S-adenosylmethionine synthetase